MKNLTVLTALALITTSSLAWVLPADPQEQKPGAGPLLVPGARGTGASPSSLSWVDVDRDGRLETLVIHPDGRAALIREAPGGGLEDCTQELGLALVPAVARVQWKDVDGDTAPDLLIVARDGSVQLLRNELENGFHDVTLGSGLDRFGSVVEAAWQDLNGDGAPDLVLVTREGLRVHENLGEFLFEAASIPLFEGAFGPAAPTAGIRPESPAPGESGSAESRPGARRNTLPSSGRASSRLPVVVEGSPAVPSGSAIPMGTANILCMDSITDQASAMCLEASSAPALGKLYPISTDLFVSPSGRVGMGTSNPNAQLEVRATGNLGLTVKSFQTGGTLVNFSSPNTSPGTPTLFAGVGVGGTAGFFEQNLSVGRLLGGQFIQAHANLGIDANNSGELRLKAGATETVELRASEGGLSNGAQLELRLADGTPTILLDAEQGTSAAELALFDRAGLETVQMRSVSSLGSGGQLILRKDDGRSTVVVDANSAVAAEISLRDSAGVETVELQSEEVAGNGGQLELRQSSGLATIILDAQQGTSPQVSLFSSTGVETVEMVAEEGTTGAQIVLRKADGTTGIVLDAEQGTDARITTETLQITGGADLVESFHTKGGCEPGTVVAIDEENPGELLPSAIPYDRRVLGVVSGAGNVQPGLHLGQRGVLDGDTPVALTGRVYVHCTTENGAIRPGDLLTSSSTPGHAMRATDRARAFGAVIGKALGALPGGNGESGLVLVLVNLQ